MNDLSARQSKALKRFEKWYEKNLDRYDLDGDGVHDWIPESIAATFQLDFANLRALRKEGVLVAKKFPTEITAVEDTPTTIDLSATKLKYFGKGRDVLTVELTVSEGTLEAVGNSKVTVIDSGTGTLTLVGTRKDIDKFLNNKTAITYTGAEDAAGDGAATLSLSHVSDGVSTEIASSSIDVTDVVDVINGTEQADMLTGTVGSDSITGLGSNDTILGAEGADTMDGGAGSDVLQYFGSDAGVTINLNADGAGYQQASGGDAEGDVITGFENVYASDFDDVIIGDDDRNILFGYDGDDSIDGNGGDDVLRGGLGADTLSGGDGTDWIRYLGSTTGVVLDLTADESGFQQASGGDAEGDVITGFENAYGSDFDDVISGNDDKNYILANAGNDSVDGGAGNDTIRGGNGADTLEGGEGADVLQYSGSTAGVSIDLNEDGSGMQQASGGDAEGDVISGFEHVYATNHSDNLIGNDDRNILYGYGGDDTLEGGDAKDVLRGGAGADVFEFKADLTSGNEDRIIDYEVGTDEIHLDSSVFAELSAGALDASQFHSNTTGLAESADHRVIYDSSTGELFYDSDGTGSAEAVLFATVTAGLALNEDEFFVL